MTGSFEVNLDLVIPANVAISAVDEGALGFI